MAASKDVDSDAPAVTGVVIEERYQVSRYLGSGSFGEIYIGVDMTNGENVAVKIESPFVKHLQLISESEVLKKMHGGVGIPAVRWAGEIGDYGTAMVMDLLGPSLEDLFNYCKRRFSTKTVLMLAEQMINRVQFVHSRLFLHRDIKPDNFLMGNNRQCNTVYLVDFGLAKRYMAGSERQQQTHIPFRQGKMLVGTARYASINAHLGTEQSRRDDMTALGYVFVYLCRGVLPWMNLKASNRTQKYDLISRCKLNTSVEELTLGFPAEYGMYIEYCRRLDFTEQPDYIYLRQVFRALFLKLDLKYDLCFDWGRHGVNLLQ